MKVVALVSGGKDSCYNMMLCQEHGHEIVALANLLPEDDSTDELDSFMYQTVGHQLIAAYATCMGLPLFRRRIRGRSKSQGLQYSATEGDEVEDLQALLAAVRERLPDVQAVSSGAIASDYQRLRVENVCSRLGLISLAFMWRREQSGLLSDMISAGVRAILVKVAAMGLSPEKHLGKDLAAMRPILERLKTLYGCNVCGEGGEYETLTLDCPLFKYARIVLDNSEVVIHSADAFAPVGILHTTKFHLEAKAPTTGPASDDLFSLQNGGLADVHHGLDVAEAEIIMVEDEAPCAGAPSSSAESGDSQKRQASTKAEEALRLNQHRQEGEIGPGSGARLEEREVRVEVDKAASDGVLWIRCSHKPTRHRNSEQASLFEAPEATTIRSGVEAVHTDEPADSAVAGSKPPKSKPGSSATRTREEAITPELSEGAVRSLLTSAESELTARGSTWADVIYVYLFLAEMGHFARANAAYKEVITEEKCACGGGVPSRSTVQVELPPGCAARVEVLVAVENSTAWGVRSTESAGELGGAQRSGEGAEESALNGGKAAGSSWRPEGRSTGMELEEGNVNGFTEKIGKEDELEGGATVGAQERGGSPLEGREREEPSGAEGSIETGRGALEFQKDGGASGAAKVGGTEIEDAHSGPRRSRGGGKKVLHVQSISSWAPSCIGPYSQATLYNGRLYMAGQLGLDPASMELVPGGAGPQMARALISCEAVAQAMGTSAQLNGETITVFCDKKCSEDELRAVREELASFLDGRPSARYTDSFTRAPSGSEESSSDSLGQPQRRDLRAEVAREMLLEAESESAEVGEADDSDAEQGEVLTRRIHDQQVKYELVPALPKGALVEVVVSCKL